MKYLQLSGLYRMVENRITVSTISDWNALNNTVGGRLFTAIPFSSSCFSEVNGHSVTPDQEQCDIIQQNYSNATFRSSQFNNFMNTQWESCMSTNSQCALDAANASDSLAWTDLPCEQGSIAPHYIDIRNYTDIQSAFNFSNATGVPLSIKNSGHDYFGRSSVAGSLGLWTRNLEHISYNASFVPDGGNKSYPAMTIGAGVPWEDAYIFADLNNVTIIGGYSQTVGASGGWLLGGGHSVLSPVFGLGVDRVLQFKLVTPDGKYRTANAYTNPDLFWALKGGGGGTFGVVTESTMIVEPRTIPLQVAAFSFNATTNTNTDFLAILAKSSLQWAHQGWGGHLRLNGLISINPLLSLEQAKKSMQNITDFVQRNNGTGGVETVSSWYEFFVKYVLTAEEPIGIEAAISSRLIPSSVFESQEARNALVETVANAEQYFLTISTVTPFIYKNYTEHSTSVTPAWRDAVWHLLFVDLWSWNTTTDGKIAVFQTLSNLTAALTDIAPDSGVYLNEANIYEPDWEHAFWGENYPKLLAIKYKYDPAGLLNCWRCVGWKGRKDSLSQCYPALD
ncbi:hypothetical protein GYMLUDRAFT_1012473 [Collybiopsis luxurians FD-317 M1]|uniref:FAD-binding PCMH-type domain-containing protein n=1 Tax=Collybiopsis luxurians FD-317 M1 TaxID=944289 RepID=A0A0D0CFT5_9AGAR|nr:hypothetical protein GYMLUDRAFT_1012473 [Collybiopsis luxurians FD-317 M1]